MSKQRGVVSGWPVEELAALHSGDKAASLELRILKGSVMRAFKLIPACGCLSVWLCAAILSLAVAAAPAQRLRAAAIPQANAQIELPKSGKAEAEIRITPEQTRQFSALVDGLISFSSEESGLPIKSHVKRQITSRTAVEKYLKEKFQEDKSSQRLQRDEIVLKKFGLLDRDFDLKPFLMALLKEQIEAYYDSKTKTVYLLNWVNLEEQKPVLAHELTHALQDQHSDLEKWNNQTLLDLSLNFHDDTDHLAKDEMDTAREAVVEGQATAVMMDYILKPMGKSLVKNPEIMDFVSQQMVGAGDSPVLARAPLLLSESLVFPYREGLNFTQNVWMDQGRTAAFTGALDRPPTSSWEIINPREYEQRHSPSVPLLPNIHPLVDKLYKPYDIGQIGQLDLHILTELFGGEQAASALTPAWNGGLYWAGQRRDANIPSIRSSKQKSLAGSPELLGTTAEQAGTGSIALFYLSVWKNAAFAKTFAQLYADELGHKYSDVKLDQTAPGAPASGEEQVYSTNEGPVVITIRGNLVFVAESFPLDLARQLTALVLDAQGVGEMHMAQAARPGLRGFGHQSRESLTANLMHFYSSYGVMKAAVEGAVQAGK